MHSGEWGEGRKIGNSCRVSLGYSASEYKAFWRDCVIETSPSPKHSLQGHVPALQGLRPARGLGHHHCPAELREGYSFVTGAVFINATVSLCLAWPRLGRVEETCGDFERARGGRFRARKGDPRGLGQIQGEDLCFE